VGFRKRLIEQNLDRALVERTVALAARTGGFGARAPRAALDSSPLASTWRCSGCSAWTSARSSAPVSARSLFCSGPLFVPSIIMTLLPASWQDTAGHYLPMNAGETIYTVQHQAHTLQPWAGFGVFSLYAAAALVTDFMLINHRDA